MTVGAAAPPRAPSRRMSGGRPGPGGRRPSRVESSHLDREMRKAVTAVTAIRILYIIFAVFTGGLGLITLVGASAVGLLGHPIILLSLAIVFGVTALYVIGAILIQKQPMVWSTLIAILQTLGALGGMRDGFTLADFITIAIAVGCWIAVVVISSAKKTFDRYKDPGGRRRGGPAPRRARRR